MLFVLIFVRVRLVGKALCFELGSHFVEAGFKKFVEPFCLAEDFYCQRTDGVIKFDKHTS